jgi:hypothetical protein
MLHSVLRLMQADTIEAWMLSSRAVPPFYFDLLLLSSWRLRTES